MAVVMKKADVVTAAPLWHAHAKETQKFGTVIADIPHPLSADVRAEMVGKLNQLLADSSTLRDMYKKHHWQVSGATFYQLHLLFDKHYAEQVDIVDTIAERIQLLGGVSVAMAADVAEMSSIPEVPKGRESAPVQISRLLEAHKLIMKRCSEIAAAADKAGDDGTNDMVVGDVLRPNELQSWFLSEHLVDTPLILDKA